MTTNQGNDEPLPTIAGYVHNVTPVKMSQNNNKYFNAVNELPLNTFWLASARLLIYRQLGWPDFVRGIPVDFFIDGATHPYLH